MSSHKEQLDFQKALELLPWYAKNALSIKDSSWVKAQLDSSKVLQDELALINKQIGFTDQYVDALDTKAFENQASRINAIKNRIKTQNLDLINDTMKTDNVKQGSNGMWDKIVSFLPQTQKHWQITGAFALMVMVVQGVIIAQLSKRDIEYTTLSGASIPTSGIVLLTAFKKGVSLNQVESFLNKNSLKIIGGPDGESQYLIGLSRNKIKGKVLNDEEVSDLIFDLLDDKNIDFILREN